MTRYNDEYDDYTPDDNNGYSSRPRRRDIDFDDSDFGNNRPAAGRRETDWADDLATRDRGRTRQPRPNRRPARDEYADDYRDNRYYNDSNNYDDDMPPQNTSFRKRHPVLMNLIYIILAASALLWSLMWFLDFWTFHGEERVVPDVKGQTYDTARGNVDLSGLRVEIADSVFDSYSRPGTVVEQTPVPGARIKKGGTVYLTVVAFTPKLITVPDFYNVSVRQARSMFEGLRIKEIREVPVVSEYAGLVLGAKFNGVALQPGARIPVSAVISLEVGSGWEESYDEGADIDSIAIDNVIEELNIE